MRAQSAAVFVAALLSFVAPVYAQNITSSSIDGVVTDESGGTLPGVTITISSPALQVPSMTMVTDAQGRYRFIDYYNSYEASVTRRLTGSWSLLAAYTATKSHRSIVGVPTSPNDEFFPLDEAWRWNLKVNGNYNLPHDFLVGAIMEIVNGTLGQRTYVFRATDASGPPLRQLAQQSIRLEPFGSRQEPHQTTFNARLGKRLGLGNRSLNMSFDVLNVLNTNAITAVTYVSGPSFGRVSDILPPRTLRAGVTLDF
jgi:hypothetical protein